MHCLMEALGAEHVSCGNGLVKQDACRHACQVSSEGHTTARYCEIRSRVHANNTLECGKLGTGVLWGLEKVLRHTVFRLGQVVKLSLSLTTVSKGAVVIVIIRLDRNSCLHRSIVPGACRSWGVPRSPWRGGPARSNCAGALWCGWADVEIVRRSRRASAFPSSRHFR